MKRSKDGAWRKQGMNGAMKDAMKASGEKAMSDSMNESIKEMKKASDEWDKTHRIQHDLTQQHILQCLESRIDFTLVTQTFECFVKVGVAGCVVCFKCVGERIPNGPVKETVGCGIGNDDGPLCEAGEATHPTSNTPRVENRDGK
jgi:hypothetical protein